MDELLPPEQQKRRGIRCILYKSVGGVYTADPKIIPEAHLIKDITYDEMMEMGSQGAKVIHPRAVEIAKQYGVEIFITSMASSERRLRWVVSYCSVMTVGGQALRRTVWMDTILPSLESNYCVPSVVVRT